MRSILLVIASLLASACYESVVPITPAADTFDPAFLGKWLEVPGAGGSAAQLTIWRFNDTEYYVEMPNVLPEERDVLRMRAYLSTVGGATFANLQEIQSAQRAYAFFRVELIDGQLHLRGLIETLPKFKTSAELHSWLQAHAQDSIYSNVGVFRRVD